LTGSIHNNLLANNIERAIEEIRGGAKDVRFATEEEVKQIMGGIEPGGVPPFGNLFGLEIIVDETLFLNPKIIFNAGDRRFSVAMKSEDYRKLVKPQVETII